MAIGSSKTCGAKRRYARQNKKKGSKIIETADLLRSVFQLQKRLKKRLIVGKSERGERELSVDYRIVDNERQEEKMCDPRTHRAARHSRYYARRARARALEINCMHDSSSTATKFRS